MRHRYRYVGLVDSDQKPFVVLRIRDSVEEIYVPERGWESADPRWRDWFMNVPIESGHALGLLHSLTPTELREDMDPYPHALSRDAADGFGTQWFYYAVETPDHPLDDPLTLVRLHYPSKSESWFTPDLMWAKTPVPGRRVRVSDEELDRLEQVLIRRASNGGDARVGPGRRCRGRVLCGWFVDRPSDMRFRERAGTCRGRPGDRRTPGRDPRPPRGRGRAGRRPVPALLRDPGGRARRRLGRAASCGPGEAATATRSSRASSPGSTGGAGA